MKGGDREIPWLPRAILLFGFGFMLVAAFPFILFKLGVDGVRDTIERKWPDSDRAEAASSWVGILAPVVFAVVIAVVSWTLVVLLIPRN